MAPGPADPSMLFYVPAVSAASLRAREILLLSWVGVIFSKAASRRLPAASRRVRVTRSSSSSAIVHVSAIMVATLSLCSLVMALSFHLHFPTPPHLHGLGTVVPKGRLRYGRGARRPFM